MPERQDTDDTRRLDEVPDMMCDTSPTTVLEESMLPGGFTKLNQPIGGGTPPAEQDPNLRGRL